MWLFQGILVLVILIFVLRLTKRFKKSEISLGSFIAWLALWLIAGFIILWPETTNYVARFLGVGRGVDVIVYLALLMLFYLSFYLIVKNRLLEREIGKIVRELSLKNNQEKKDN